ncbi:phage tail protein [Pedobacter sp. MR22-3]|uniref:phage tail protein n=1 Tax=Pedobacter sp. MR22-3 TaxID=2994552 RepID=UPI0022451D7D|nr:tail fiber protein [Pedobacter sp. MR22-3]MCX2583534.1 tail fiber protein [Pedobacter sp. MR22-3]
MEGTIGEIRMFAGTFAPRYWSICNGQMLQVRGNTALFAIIGNIYGGDGKTTFMLPDLQGRTIVGAGQGQGLSLYDPGDALGVEALSINSSEMSAHNHNLIYTAAAGTATVTIKVLADQYDQPGPAGNLLGAPDALGESIYGVPQGMAQEVPMATGTLTVTKVTGPQLTSVTIAATGAAVPAVHENRQPSLALNYMICLLGNFPMRN